MSRIHSSSPSTSNALRMPVPVITQTRSPSVTGDGDDMFCFRSRRFPPPRCRCQSGSPVSRSRHQSSMLSSSTATLRKIRSPQTIGVDPDQAGIASFQAMFRSVSHSTGRFVSVLTPSPVGPRQAGQFSARATPDAQVAATSNTPATQVTSGFVRMLPPRRRSGGPTTTHGCPASRRRLDNPRSALLGPGASDPVSAGGIGPADADISVAAPDGERGPGEPPWTPVRILPRP